MTVNRKLFGVRCDVGARAPSEWLWLCVNGEPLLFGSLDEARRAKDRVSSLAIPDTQWVATLYGIETK